MSSNVREFVYNFFSQNSSEDVGSLADFDHLNYVDKKFLDSLGIVRMIIELEKTFSIRFSNDELQSKEFTTISGLITIIESKI